MARLSNILLATSLIGSSVQAASLPHIAFLSMGFREATATDFAKTPEALLRHANATDFLAVTADFNGDGKADEARILLNEERKIAYVVAVIQSSAKVDTFVLAQMPLSDVNNVGIVKANPLDGQASRGWAGVTILALDRGDGEANYFDGNEFSIHVPVIAHG